MAFNHPLQTVGLLGIILIGPNSEALLSNPSSVDMNNAGYHCTSGQQYRQINIRYQADTFYTETCSVSHQKNTQEAKVLWHKQRNTFSCETKAKAIALRLQDRGWSCQTAGI
ncbi:MAG: hypothetical protein ACI9D5_001389 [Candidatus Endobugula sp.]|jgi:hypothetical protein